MLLFTTHHTIVEAFLNQVTVNPHPSPASLCAHVQALAAQMAGLSEALALVTV